MLNSGEVNEIDQQIDSTLGLGDDPGELSKKRRAALERNAELEKWLVTLKKEISRQQ